MEKDVKWITKNGKHIPITNNYMNNKIRNNAGKSSKEDYFNENFYFQDDDYYKEFNQNKENFDYTEEKDWDKNEIAYNNERAGIYYKRISVMDKNTGEEAGHVKYKEVYDFNKTDLTDRINVDEISVKEKYRRKGIATQLYKELQRRAGNEDIFFGELTPDGKKLVESIGIINKKTNEKYPYYWGRIN